MVLLFFLSAFFSDYYICMCVKMLVHTIYIVSYVDFFSLNIILSIFQFLWTFFEINCYMFYQPHVPQFMEPLMLEIYCFLFPTIINITARNILVYPFYKDLSLFPQDKVLKVACSFYILITMYRQTTFPENVLPIYNTTNRAWSSKRLNDLPKIKQLGSGGLEIKCGHRYPQGYGRALVGRWRMGWPEVIESGALKLTWVKMDGLMRQLQKTGCSTDNTCNFILSIKLPRSRLFPLESVQTKEE